MGSTSKINGTPGRKRMRAFAVSRFGEPGSIMELPKPVVPDDGFLVRVRAAGVNPIDWKVADGGKADLKARFPLVLGQDAAGTVEQVDASVTRFKVGDEVFGAFWLSGTYADYVLGTPAAAVARKPASLDFAHAAALPTPALAALASANAVEASADQTILVNGSTGGVGSYAVQITAARGVRVIATAREETDAYVRNLGATETIDYTKQDLVETVKAIYPDGIDALIDVVSDRETLGRVAGVLRSGARLATTVHAADIAALAKRGLTAINIDVLGTTEGLDEIAGLVDAGKIVVPLEKVFAFDQTAQAIARSRAGQIRGKIVLAGG